MQYHKDIYQCTSWMCWIGTWHAMAVCISMYWYQCVCLVLIFGYFESHSGNTGYIVLLTPCQTQQTSCGAAVLHQSLIHSFHTVSQFCGQPRQQTPVYSTYKEPMQGQTIHWDTMICVQCHVPVWNFQHRPAVLKVFVHHKCLLVRYYSLINKYPCSCISTLEVYVLSCCLPPSVPNTAQEGCPSTSKEEPNCSSY